MATKKKRKPKVVTDTRQFVFDFVQAVPPMEYVCETPAGHALYRILEVHGGYSYWNTDYGTGFMVYDEGLTNIIDTFLAMNHLGIGETMWRHLGVVFDYKIKE